MRMNQEQYLSHVLGKLETAISELEGKMEFRRSEIAKMQEYYWESYNEYDEFGYEKFDNDRLLKEEMDSHSELSKNYARYQKMKDSPFLQQLPFVMKEKKSRKFIISVLVISLHRKEMSLWFVTGGHQSRVCSMTTKWEKHLSKHRWEKYSENFYANISIR